MRRARLARRPRRASVRRERRLFPHLKVRIMNLHAPSTLLVIAIALTGAAGSAAAQDPPPKPDGFTVGGFTFRPGGRVKLDVIRDFKPIGNEDAFDTRTIPIDGGDRVNSNLHAKETRLYVDVRGDVDGDELRFYVETDFYGSGSALRLRHAYGTYKGLLAGQTWSAFV